MASKPVSGQFEHHEILNITFSNSSDTPRYRHEEREGLKEIFSTGPSLEHPLVQALGTLLAKENTSE